MDTKNLSASFLIVNYRQNIELKSLVNYINTNFKYNFEILIFNNSRSNIKFSNANIKVYSVNKNIGYATAIDFLATKAKYAYFYILNPDIKFIKNINSSLIKFSSLPLPYGVFSLAGADKTITTPLFSKFLSSTKRYSSFAFIVYKETFLVLGGYNPKYFMYFEDEDFNKKLNKFKIKTYYPKKPYVKHLKTYKNINLFKRKYHYYKSFLLFLKNNHFFTYLLFYIPLKILIWVCKFFK